MGPLPKISLRDRPHFGEYIEVSSRNAPQMETPTSAPVNSLRLRSDRPKNSKPPRKATNCSNRNALRQNSSMPVHFPAGRKDIRRNTLPALRMVQPALIAVKKATFSMFAMENGMKEFASLTPKIPRKTTQLRMSISLF